MRFVSVVLCTCVGVVGASWDAQAMSLGRVRSAVTLGQPLNVAVPIVLDEGEALEPQCVRAEVMHGDSLWPSNVVRMRLNPGNADSSRVLRITSTVVVEEPVLSVVVQLGCPTKFSRAYTLLADPPIALATAASDAESDNDLARQDRTSAVASAPASASSVKPTPRARRASSDQRATAGMRSKTVAPKRADDRSRTKTPEPKAEPATQPVGGTAQARGPRLQLDDASVSYSQSLIDAAQAQAKAADDNAKAAAAASAASMERMRVLEVELAKLREDAKLQLEATMALRAQLAASQNQAQWLPWLVGAALISSGLALWVLARGRQPKRRARDHWSQADKTSPETMVDSKLDSTLAAKVTRSDATTGGLKGGALSRLPAESQAHGVAHSVIAKAAATAQPMVPTTVMATRTADKSIDRPSERAAAMAEAQRAVTVDEQIDLEQEADFFIALGHDDAAIDLLLAHLRTTGGAVPMPYLKLMELYRRRGDRDDHDLMRRRFNQRFNSVAPEWDHDPQAGKLLDQYPALVARLQKVWSKPLDAMAELEAMAFGRREDNQEVIDLPAYQEVLFLFQLARTLHDEGAAEKAQDVDVLLPLAGDTSAVDLSVPLSLDLDVSTQPVLGVEPSGGPMPYRPNLPGALPSIDTSMVPGPSRSTSPDKV